MDTETKQEKKCVLRSNWNRGSKAKAPGISPPKISALSPSVLKRGMPLANNLVDHFHPGEVSSVPDCIPPTASRDERPRLDKKNGLGVVA